MIVLFMLLSTSSDTLGAARTAVHIVPYTGANKCSPTAITSGAFLEAIITALVQDPLRRFVLADVSPLASWYLLRNTTAFPAPPPRGTYTDRVFGDRGEVLFATNGGVAANSADYPSTWGEAAALVAGRGQLDFASGAWMAHDHSTTSPQMLWMLHREGRRWLEETLPAHRLPSVAWLLSPTAHSAFTPTFYGSLGCDSAVVGAPPGVSGHSGFGWRESEHIHGLLTVTVEYESVCESPPGFAVSTFTGNPGRQQLQQAAAAAISHLRTLAAATDGTPVFLPIDARGLLSELKHWDIFEMLLDMLRRDNEFDIMYSTPSTYFAAVREYRRARGGSLAIKVGALYSQEEFEDAGADNSIAETVKLSRPLRLAEQRLVAAELAVARLDLSVSVVIAAIKSLRAARRDLMAAQQPSGDVTSSDKVRLALLASSIAASEAAAAQAFAYATAWDRPWRTLRAGELTDGGMGSEVLQVPDGGGVSVVVYRPSSGVASRLVTLYVAGGASSTLCVTSLNGSAVVAQATVDSTSGWQEIVFVAELDASGVEAYVISRGATATTTCHATVQAEVAMEGEVDQFSKVSSSVENALVEVEVVASSAGLHIRWSDSPNGAGAVKHPGVDLSSALKERYYHGEIRLSIQTYLTPNWSARTSHFNTGYYFWRRAVLSLFGYALFVAAMVEIARTQIPRGGSRWLPRLLPAESVGRRLGALLNYLQGLPILWGVLRFGGRGGLTQRGRRYLPALAWSALGVAGGALWVTMSALHRSAASWHDDINDPSLLGHSPGGWPLVMILGALIGAPGYAGGHGAALGAGLLFGGTVGFAARPDLHAVALPLPNSVVRTVRGPIQARIEVLPVDGAAGGHRITLPRSGPEALKTLVKVDHKYARGRYVHEVVVRHAAVRAGDRLHGSRGSVTANRGMFEVDNVRCCIYPLLS